MLLEKPFLLLPLWADYPCNDSILFNSRTRSAAQTARAGLNAAWLQARFISSALIAGYTRAGVGSLQSVLDVLKKKTISLFTNVILKVN